MKKYALIAALLSSLFAGSVQAAIVTHSTDFIADATRTGFNGFESIPNDGVHYTGGTAPYVEGGIRVQQIGGDGGNDIWIGYNFWSGAQGNAWYPDGGDNGYTQISLASGANFFDVGFNIGSGGGASQAIYELFDDGLMVLSGSASMATNYLGFSGGGFDTIRIRDNINSSVIDVDNGTFQALALDNIEVRAGGTVPEPASLLLLSLGLLGVVASRRQAAR